MVDSLQGTINLESERDIEEAKNDHGFQPARSSQASGGNQTQVNTLDEPVMDTIVSSHTSLDHCFYQKRDLMRIWEKLRIVINPFTQPNTEQKRKEIRNWDLWGPFFFCLILAS